MNYYELIIHNELLYIIHSLLYKIVNSSIHYTKLAMKLIILLAIVANKINQYNIQIYQ